MEGDVPFAGEVKCRLCSCKAYYRLPWGGEFCGRHAKVSERRIDLPRLSKIEVRAKAAREKLAHQSTVAAAKAGKPQGTFGVVTLQRMRMMRAPTMTLGKALILPNNRHGSHPLAAFDCCALSPMRLGPVEHGQPGLPPSLNLENFHQGSKCYAEEVDSKGQPSSVFSMNRLAMYVDDKPHRHKECGGLKTKLPLYFVWIDRDGTEKHLTYIESRQFYCTFYERLASQKPEFARLRAMVVDGIDLEICGYDAYPLEKQGNYELSYIDPQQPFGHERVLAAMLTLNPTEYPWRTHKTFEF